jgi:hypothetical protein
MLTVEGGRWSHRDRLGELEIEHRFGRQLDLLTLRHALYACAGRSTSTSTDGCTLAATSDPADDGAERSAAANRGGRAFTTP